MMGIYDAIIRAVETWAGEEVADPRGSLVRAGVQAWPVERAVAYGIAIDEVIELIEHIRDGRYDEVERSDGGW